MSWSPLSSSSESGTAPVLRGGAPSAAAADDAILAKVRNSTLVAPLALALLCAGFFWIEAIYCRHLPLVMDELQGASAVHHMRDLVPYVDFTPYKNVLGYYVQLPFMLLSRGLWAQMMAVKLGMAGITALVVFLCAWSLTRLIRPGAVVLATAALFAMSTFLERAAELRVDMLTALAGLASFVLLLSRRYALAGAACGISFLISQKGVYYCAAGVVALFGARVMLPREQVRLRDAFAFGGVTAAIIGAYLFAFGSMTSFGSVADVSLARPIQIALADDYKNMARFWLQTVQRNPYFYALAVLGLGSALERARREQSTLDWMIFAYVGTVLMLSIGHRQPWPYFFVIVIPILWVAVARQIEQLAPHGKVFWSAYLLIGLLFPLFTRVPAVLARDSGHQRYTIELAERVLRENETYLAGIDMVYTREQSPHMLAWLDRPRLEALAKMSGPDLVADLRARPPKLVIGNYRIDGLPVALRKALRGDYEHLWASVWMYAPTIRSEEFTLAYAGDYTLGNPEAVQIDNHVVAPGEIVHLRAGQHLGTATGYRLRLLAPRKVIGSLDMRYRLPADLFPAVYDY